MGSDWLARVASVLEKCLKCDLHSTQFVGGGKGEEERQEDPSPGRIG